MQLSKPPLATVHPGEPVTAQGWNALTTSLSKLYEAVIVLSSLTQLAVTQEVAVTAGGKPVPAATVVAEPVGSDHPGRPTVALPPYGARATHLLVGLIDGQWRVHVQAAGFITPVVTTNLPLSNAQPLNVALTAAGVVMPDLFAGSAEWAAEKLAAAKIPVKRCRDTTGQLVPIIHVTGQPHFVLPNYKTHLVLFQLPSAGTMVDADLAARVTLVLASESD